jgi:hypothetical protein
MSGLRLEDAVVVVPAGLTGPRERAVRMLVEEVEKRTGIRWPVTAARPARGAPVILVGTAEELRGTGVRHADLEGSQGPLPAEGFCLRTFEGGVEVVGNDARGVLFGVGRLLRELRMGRGGSGGTSLSPVKTGRVELPSDLDVCTAPVYPLRGHQLGYRPKTNSYDGWTEAMWEQYYRDLAVFGANAVELIPPRSDDDPDSPHFPLPPMEMMVRMSRLAAEYGLDVWVWYPALDQDYSDPATVEFALREWEEAFVRLPRLDAVFVPGGDPGHTRPVHLMALLERQAESLRRHHPGAGMWVAPQGFTAEWMEEFLDLAAAEPPWLTGVVFGPQTRLSLPELRTQLPRRYPIRHYPDITHCFKCQYPVPDWDAAYALTEGREPINPRPLAQAAIFRRLQEHTEGFITYSEGCNDDVNKTIWSVLGWDPEADVVEALRQYGRYFIGDGYGDPFAQGLLALERNWEGPLLTNEGVETTLRQFQALEQEALPAVRLNWRFQQALYRAYYDAYTRRRLLHEQELEARALEALRSAGATGAQQAVDRAEAILDRAFMERPAPDWRARIFELAEALFQSIRMQLSVERYAAIAVGRGANLDTVDAPLNDAPWLRGRFREVRAEPGEAERLRMVEEILGWTDPGPGGFYDDLGRTEGSPRLLPGPGFPEDPAFLQSPFAGFGERGDGRLSWYRHVQTLHETPLRLRYTGLDPDAEYRLRVVYSPEGKGRVSLTAGDGIEIHPLIPKPSPPAPLEFALPAEATAAGTLELCWQREPGLGGNGRGCQVAEVWLIRR